MKHRLNITVPRAVFDKVLTMVARGALDASSVAQMAVDELVQHRSLYTQEMALVSTGASDSRLSFNVDSPALQVVDEVASELGTSRPETVRRLMSVFVRGREAREMREMDGAVWMRILDRKEM